MTMPLEHNREIIDERSTVPRPPGLSPRSEHLENSLDTQSADVPAPGPRVRWGGVISGLVIALGVVLLLSALGLAVGITVVGDPRAATGETASGLGMGAGIWTFVTLLVAFFLAGMVSTQVTDRPDRGGAVLHGALVWVLCTVFLFWLIASGISLGLSGLFGAVGGLARGATAATVTAVSGGDLTKSLGLEDPQQVIDKLDNPQTASLFATATGLSPMEARAALGSLRARVETVRDNPERVAAEVRNFLGQYTERAKQQALATAATVQRGATVGSWLTFTVMAVTLLVSIAGALSGVPTWRRWRPRLMRARVA